MDESELRSNVEEALSTVLSDGGVFDLEDSVVTLRGTVFSEEESLLAERQVARVPGVKEVVNKLRVELGDPLEAAPRSLVVDTDDFPAPETIGTEDVQEAVEWAEPYYPPVDPVVEPARTGEGLEVVGGFSGSDLEEPFDTRERVFPPESDDLICDQIATMLHRDAATTDLPISVDCNEGVVTLRGRVPSLQDAETAEWLAGRIPGVVEVRDELEIEGV